MNFLLRMLLGSTMGTGFGDRFSKDQTGDLASLTSALRDERENPASMSRLADAFSQLKDMHKDPAMAQAMAQQQPMSPFDVPMPQQRPQQQPQMAQANPFQGLF